MAPRKLKEVKPIELAIPQPVDGIDRWIILVSILRSRAPVTPSC